MAIESNREDNGRQQGISGLVERMNAIVRAIAQPSLTQLVLRFALAVPFWRSGILKWDGFLHLNDTAILLFSSEFQLHLPGGPHLQLRHLPQVQRRSFYPFSLLSVWQHAPPPLGFSL